MNVFVKEVLFKASLNINRHCLRCFNHYGAFEIEDNPNDDSLYLWTYAAFSAYRDGKKIAENTEKHRSEIFK